MPTAHSLALFAIVLYFANPPYYATTELDSWSISLYVNASQISEKSAVFES